MKRNNRPPRHSSIAMAINTILPALFYTLDEATILCFYCEIMQIYKHIQVNSHGLLHMNEKIIVSFQFAILATLFLKPFPAQTATAYHLCLQIHCA